MARSAPTKSRGLALLATIMLLSVLLAMTAGLTTQVGAESIVAGRSANNLHHRLAVDSALQWLATSARKTGEPIARLGNQSSRGPRSQVGIGRVQVTLTVENDAAKFNPNVIGARHQQGKLLRALQQMATKLHLPAAAIELRPINTELGNAEPQRPYVWFDQVLKVREPGVLLDAGGSPEIAGSSVWSEAVTFWGDGRIDLAMATRPLLDAALSDIRSGLGSFLMAKRRIVAQSGDIHDATNALDDQIRDRVAARLSWGSNRVAIRITTSIGSDSRQWYVVARVDGATIDVLHRSQLLW